MRRRAKLLLHFVGTLAASIWLAAQAPVREPLTVMTFNIRYGTANDGDNAWSARRELLFDVLRDQNADLVGLQEALDHQLTEIAAALPIYATVGVGRDDGRKTGEYAAILFRRDRFRVAATDTFWFSDTPAVVASKSWGNSITRICTWARFVDRDGRGFWHYNVHLDHQSQPSRERSTQLLRQRIEARPFPNEPVVVTGDFNVGETNPAMQTLTGGLPPRSDAPFLDTFRVLHPERRESGTFSGFKYGAVTGDKIDYVLVQPGTEVLNAEIVQASRDSRYPSDHFPVVARVILPEH